MNKTLGNIFKTDLISLLTILLINGYSLLSGTMRKYDKIADTLDKIDLSKYIENADIIDVILNIISGGFNIILIIYILAIVIYLILSHIVPLCVDYILLKITTNNKIVCWVWLVISNISPFIISIILLEPIFILMELGILGIMLNTALSVIVYLGTILIKIVFMIKGTLYKGVDIQYEK